MTVVELREKARGFTLVELLVVIVVIAILAVVTIVAYNGIQSRAYYAKIYATVNAYAKALTLYRVENGSYPANVDWVCLGREEDYPATAAFPQDVCLVNPNGANEVWDATINNSLLGYIDQLPDANYPQRTDNHGYLVRGLEYDSVTAGFNNPTITYYIDSSENCPVGKPYAGVAYNTRKCVVELPYPR